jgi:CheY-like chemotaxis protein
LLDRLDAADADNPAKNRRAMARIPFRRVDVACRIYHPGGSMTTAAIATRNLSAGGTSFLYHGFLHKNTKIELVLARRLGGEDVIAGTVTHCQHINRAFHLIGMRFAAKIFPKLYLDPADWNDLGDGQPVDPAALGGSVLHVDESEMDRLLLRHHLSTTKIELTSVGTISEAADAIKTKLPDAVLCDVADNDAAQLILALRVAGFNGPVGLLTAETAPATRKAATAAGAAAVLPKPYDVQKMLSLLGTWLSAGAGEGEAIYSTLAESPATKPLIEQYVQRVRVLLRDLQKAVQADDIKGVRAVTQTLRGTGAGFGFAAVTQIAKDAVTTLDETQSVREAQVHLQRLEVTCRRLTAK